MGVGGKAKRWGLPHANVIDAAMALECMFSDSINIMKAGGEPGAQLVRLQERHKIPGSINGWFCFCNVSNGCGGTVGV